VIPDHWENPAACAGHPHAEWFDSWIDGEGPHQQRTRHGRALGVCAGCPARVPCLTYAITTRPRVEGVWGGRVFEPRRNEIRRENDRAERRGRPPEEIRHGTESGAKQHRRSGEDPCASCQLGERHARQDRARKKAAS
jgi:WhiB family redox-sensing transcriptional regulator